MDNEHVLSFLNEEVEPTEPEVIKPKPKPKRSSKPQTKKQKGSPPSPTSLNLEVLTRIEQCPYCGSHFSHLTNWNFYWTCGICKNSFVGQKRI